MYPSTKSYETEKEQNVLKSLHSRDPNLRRIYIYIGPFAIVAKPNDHTYPIDVSISLSKKSKSIKSILIYVKQLN